MLAGLHPRSAEFNSVIAIANQARFRRNYTSAIKELDALLQVNRAGAADDFSFCFLNLQLGDLRRLSGDVGGAKTNYAQARDRLLALLTSQPNNTFFLRIPVTSLCRSRRSGSGDEKHRSRHQISPD